MSIDHLIRGDLAALGEASRQNLPTRDPHNAGIYRDGRAGAEARRDELANERRIQLALMPLSVAQVFAHRVGRAAAGAMAVACAFAMVLLVSDPFVMRLVQWAVPGLGINLGMCLTTVACAVLVAYVAGTWAAEAYFTRRMRGAVQTGDDVYTDLDQLARGPIDLAQQLARKVDGWAVGLPLAGIASLAAIVGYLLALTLALAPTHYVLSTTTVFSSVAADRNIGSVGYALVLGLAAAYVVGRACQRDTPLATRLLRFDVAIATVVLGMVTLMFAGDILLRASPAETSAYDRNKVAVLGEITAVLASSVALLWWRRRERARLGD